MVDMQALPRHPYLKIYGAIYILKFMAPINSSLYRYPMRHQDFLKQADERGVMLSRLEEFNAKSLEYDRHARLASDQLARASYTGLAEACRELAKMIMQLEEIRALSGPPRPSRYFN